MTTNSPTSFLTLELNKTYKTRAGNLVKIIDIDYSYTRPFLGNIVTNENKIIRVAAFNASGIYKNGEQSEFDIISIYDSNSDKEYFNLQN